MSLTRVLGTTLAAAILSAQQPGPVFRSGTRLVEVSVTVLDRKGNAVTGLEPGDFTVMDGNQKRPVAVFHYEGVPEMAAAPAAPPPPGVFTNKVEATGGPPRNVTALVIDSLNTAAQDNMLARAQLMRYLKAMTPESRMALYHMGQQLRVLQDYTDDPALLRTRLEKAVIGSPLENVTDYTRSIIEAEEFVNMFAGDPAMQKIIEDMMRNSLEMEGMANAASRRARMERSLAAMEALGRHLAGIPGRKNMVWISSGFSMFSITGNLGMGPHGDVSDYEYKVLQTSQHLAQQGITLYIVDPKGLQMEPGTGAEYRGAVPVRGRGRFEPQMDSEKMSNDVKPAMELMAAVTGGRYMYNSNDLTAGLKQIVADLHGTYTLGFYASDEPDSKWHKLKVRVNRSGASVRHREGYLAEAVAPQPEQWTNQMWAQVVTNPIGSSVIPMTAKCVTTAAGDLDVTVTIDPSHLSFHPDGEKLTAHLQIALADRTGQGQAKLRTMDMTAEVAQAQWKDATTRGINFHHQWKPPAETSAVRVVVRDVETNAYGTLDIPLSKVAR